ncbi:predicted protein [Naegleria gruberi]|uniref:Predicted protein n=1 Tax=Naegleria gruberi TaxID=5762 RepID=D2VGM7_NAEGR|nr:uncharacterized protein NAEGRDRAFT_68033 [Naegleria gruberi]EFC43994.1 predicted protein [Naegleria gruberi]|eukprot:XP_002676738.1 predicted protein [Naegleria gruberi strain NEG-M]
MYNLKRIFGFQVLNRFDEGSSKKLLSECDFSQAQQMAEIIEYMFVKDLSKQLSNHIKVKMATIKDVTTIVNEVNQWVTTTLAQFNNQEEIVLTPIEKSYSYFSDKPYKANQNKITKKSDNYELNTIKFMHKGSFSIEQFFSNKIFEKQCITEKQPNPLSKRFLHKSVFIRSKNCIVTYGGFAIGKGITDDIIKFDLEQKKATQSTSRKGRIFHTFDYLPHLNKMVVYGGIEKTGSISSDLISISMDFSSDVRSNEFLPPLCCHSAVTLFDTLYIFGGFNGSTSKYSNTMYSLHIPTLSIKSSASKFCPSERIGSAMTIVGDNIFVFGGMDSNGNILSDIYRYNISQDLFHPILSDEYAINPKLCFSNMFIIGNNIYLFGGWNGVEWNNSLFETSKEEFKWKIAKGYTNSISSDFNSYNPMSSIVPVSEKIIYLLGGLDLPFPFISILDTFATLATGKIDFTISNTKPSYRIFQHKRQTDEFLLSQTYLNWFKKQIPEECDVTILVNIPNQVEQELFYGFKLVLVRSPVLSRKILEQEGHNKWRNLKHGSHAVILLDDFPSNVENLRRSFNSVLEYLYSGSFSTKDLKSEDYSDIYKVACYLEIPLLYKALDGTLNVDDSLETKNLLSTITIQLDHLFSPCETISNIEDFMTTIDENPIAPGMVKIIAPTSLDSSTYQSILVHKFILTQRCRYFNAVFEMNFLESHTRVVLIEQNTFKGLLSILHFVYTGNIVELDLSNAVEIFMSSFQFELEELMEASKLFIREHEFDVFTTIRLLEICETVNDKIMQDYCKYSIAKRYEIVMKHDPSALDNLSKVSRVDINDLRKSVLKH